MHFSIVLKPALLFHTCVVQCKLENDDDEQTAEAMEDESEEGSMTIVLHEVG